MHQSFKGSASGLEGLGFFTVYCALWSRGALEMGFKQLFMSFKGMLHGYL